MGLSNKWYNLIWQIPCIVIVYILGLFLAGFVATIFLFGTIYYGVWMIVQFNIMLFLDDIEDETNIAIKYGVYISVGIVSVTWFWFYITAMYYMLGMEYWQSIILFILYVLVWVGIFKSDD